MPARAEVVGIGQRPFRVFDQRRRDAVPGVHVGATGDEPDPESLGRPEHAIVVTGSAEVDRARGPALEQLDDTVIAVQRGLVGPHLTTQPLEQLELVRLVTQQRLDDVDVTLDEARHHQAVGGVDDLTRRDAGRSPTRHPDETTPVDEDVALERLAVDPHGGDEPVTDVEIDQR